MIARYWQTYWFRPAPLINLAICRMVLVGVQILLLGSFSSNYNQWVQRFILPDSMYNPLPILRLLAWPFNLTAGPSLDSLIVIYWVTLLAGVLAFIGLRTTVSMFIFTIGNVVLQSFLYSFGDLHHPEAFMLIALFILTLSSSGRVLSLDALWKQRRRQAIKTSTTGDETSIFSRWPLLLIQWMFVLIYLDAALSKLSRSGLDWMNGYTLQWNLFRNALERGSDIGVWLAHQHLLAQVLSWTTIVWEGTFILVLLWPKSAWVYIPTGVALHVGMCLCKVACFYQFLALYVVFIPWAHLLRNRSQDARRFPPQPQTSHPDFQSSAPQ